MVREDTLDYEQQREANIRANHELLSSLGIAPAKKAATRSTLVGVKSTRSATVAANGGAASKRQTRNPTSGSSGKSATAAQQQTNENAQDNEEAEPIDADGGDEDYEAQRAANIRANLELMMSLGLYQTSASINPKPAATPKAAPKPKTSSSSSSSHAAIMERPKRITRRVSRMLDSPRQPFSSIRKMKRALSDDFIYPSSGKRSRRRGSYTPSDEFESDSDSAYTPSRSKRYKGGNPFARRSLNPTRSYRDSTELQRSADRLGVRIHDPKRFGSIPGIPVGTWWEKRIHCSTDAVHAPTVAGISGDASVGCWSICLSGGYEDDIDSGTSFTYTGSGGRDLKGTKQNPKNLRTAPQSKDQSWDGKNAALKKSVETGKPIRVVRGYKGANEYCPKEGYVYSGLYRVKKAWMERGASGFLVCRFEFERLQGQDVLPTFDHSVQDEEEEGENANEQEKDNEEEEEEGEGEGEGEEEDDEVREVTQREIRLLNRIKSISSSSIKNQPTIDLTSPSPEPEPSPSPSPSPSPNPLSVSLLESTLTSPSPHPILQTNSKDHPFDRSAYIIISSSSSDSNSDSDKEEGETEQQLELELDQNPKIKPTQGLANNQSWVPFSFSRFRKNISSIV
ncbi:uncharacterized protein UTRI_06262_B [Ustilago trichophora]|uniref:YDG domain-containing protein n=1 Tax=Ustilago trichophora TaxID=86804 RepID=A0A5C3EJX5_9BASI|nr:uncharacterized protein UTRI_06262_B [Ustilago trichophora]